jgi:ADP-ribosylglycohydrolase
LVEFQTPERIRRNNPNGVTELVAGGTWNNLAGQLTDDSEMALMLARSLVSVGTFDSKKVLERYQFWISGGPFDSGGTTRAGLAGNPIFESQANGSLMRISPLGIFGVNHSAETVAAWAEADAALTHPNEVPVAATALFAMAIAHVIKTGCTAQELYALIAGWAETRNDPQAIRDVIAAAATTRPDDYVALQGWVLIAFQNALWQLLHTQSFRAGVEDTVMQGGDTDTNAAICGALLGAVYGRESVPQSWVDALLNCRPTADDPNCFHPRPEVFWPVDVLELAAQLAGKQA